MSTDIATGGLFGTGPTVCTCRSCTCPCARQAPHTRPDSIDEDEYTIIGSDTASVASNDLDEDEPIGLFRRPSETETSNEDLNDHLRLLLRYRFAAPDESVWNEAIQMHLETERLRLDSVPRSMEASCVSIACSDLFEDDDYQRQRSMSMVVEGSPHSPLSSLESSQLCMAPSQQSRRPSAVASPLRNNSISLFNGIGSLFDDNHFISSPLKVNAEPEFCLNFSAPPRSFSLPSIAFGGSLEGIPEQTPVGRSTA